MSNAPFNPPLSNPGLADLLAEVRKEIFLNLNCHAIGTVEAFDDSEQTITATINYTKTFYQKDERGTFNPVSVNYPVLLNCPVFILSGGNAFVSMPIAKGDQVLLMFNDRDIDNWFSGATSGPVNSGRLHSISDAIALIGLFPLNKSISSYDLTRARLQNGDAYVGVSSTKIKIANGSTTLNTQLQDLSTQLENLCSAIALITVTCATPGSPSSPPINAATFSTISTQISSIATQIGGLLE